MPKRFAKPPTQADMRLVSSACQTAQEYMHEAGQEHWMKPYLDGRLDQALTNVRGAVKRDREATAARR